MKQLERLHQRFVKEASSVLPSSRCSPPVVPAMRTVPIVPQDAWVKKNDGDVEFIEKTFSFETFKERNEFIIDVIDVEAEHKHCSVMTIDEMCVRVRLFTRNVRAPTSIDKELAAYMDEIHSDVTFQRTFSRPHT